MITEYVCVKHVEKNRLLDVIALKEAASGGIFDHSLVEAVKGDGKVEENILI